MTSVNCCFIYLMYCVHITFPSRSYSFDLHYCTGKEFKNIKLSAINFGCHYKNSVGLQIDSFSIVYCYLYVIVKEKIYEMERKYFHVNLMQILILSCYARNVHLFY